MLDQEDKAESEKSKREIRCIRRHEETRRSWRAINRSQGKSRNNGISAVQIKDGDEWHTVSKRDEVEPAIIQKIRLVSVLRKKPIDVEAYVY